jgi:hypothetical protein
MRLGDETRARLGLQRGLVALEKMKVSRTLLPIHMTLLLNSKIITAVMA